MITPTDSSPVPFSNDHYDRLNCIISDYSMPWLALKEMVFQVKFEKVGFDIKSGAAIESIESGNTDLVGSFQLIDTTANFTNPPISIGDLVVNASTGQSSYVTIVSTTAITTSGDIFGSGTLGDEYRIYSIQLVLNNITWGQSGFQFSPAAAAENSLVIENFYPNTTNRFVVEVDIENYSGGALQVMGGTAPVSFSMLGESPNANSNGTWSFYGIPVGLDLKLIDLSGESDYTLTGLRIYYVARAVLDIYSGETLVDSISPSFNAHDRSTFKLGMDYELGCYQFYLNNFNGLVGRINFQIQSDPPWSIDNVGTGWAFVANQLVHTSGGAVGTNKAAYLIDENFFTTTKSCNYVIFFTLEPLVDKPSVFILTNNGEIDVSDYIPPSAGPSYYINIKGYEITGVEFRSTEIDNVTVKSFNIYNTYYNKAGGYFTPSGKELLSSDRIAPFFCTPFANIDLLDDMSEYVLLTGEIVNDFIIKETLSRWLDTDEVYKEQYYVIANLRFPDYQDDSFDLSRNDFGNNKLLNSDRIIIYELQGRPVPQQVIDWITWAIRTKDFRINAKQYVSNSGSLSPNWDRFSSLGGFIIDVFEQNKILKIEKC